MKGGKLVSVDSTSSDLSPCCQRDGPVSIDSTAAIRASPVEASFDKVKKDAIFEMREPIGRHAMILESGKDRQSMRLFECEWRIS